MNFCAGKRKAIVKYTKPNKERVRVELNQVPINITIEPSSPGTYRFYGVGDDKLFYEFTASGINPGYSVNSGFNGRGMTPTMNSAFIKPQSYYYVSGYGIQEIVKAVGCQIKITGSSNVFTDTVECPNGNYEVSCDDECPLGHIRCECDSYPGYCCIPCSEIRSEIAAATTALRSINRG
ncbi:hypothetical protein FACHB389_35910 [Nostoc calcicola FACHB-389]|nr:hypothetical protein [Nostoc calcicola FACHB-3891]OKH14607.1 hypothetical protein FACHB389_35910 [Nostoc calcicola FACHB-389]